MTEHFDNLVGWHVVEAGLRQAWPFVTFCPLTHGNAEKRLYIDTDFFVREGTGAEVNGSPLTRIESLLLLTANDVRQESEGVTIEFDTGATLAISATPNAATSHDVWWFAETSRTVFPE